MKMLAQAAFGKEALRRVNNVILPLNDSGSGMAFYCVHCVTGMASGFRFMAEMLGPQQRFYGIQTPTDKRNAEFASSIESISQCYVDELVKFQANGSFLLGGYSTGAIIALEIAEQLQSRGRDVSLIVVFDGELFNTGAEIESSHSFDWFGLLWNFQRWAVGVAKEDYDIHTLWRKAVSKVIATQKVIIAKARGKVPTLELTAERFVNIDLNKCSTEHVAFIRRLFQVQYDYVPKRYPGRVLVYAASTQRRQRLRQLIAAWRAIAPASEIIEISGTHNTIMRPPNGYVLARHLAARIAEIQSQTVGSPPV